MFIDCIIFLYSSYYVLDNNFMIYKRIESIKIYNFSFVYLKCRSIPE